MMLQHSSFELPSDYKDSYLSYPNDLPEAKIHSQVCTYLKKHYPSVVFLTDASGMKFDAKTASKFAKLKSSSGVPDLVILEPRLGFNALLIEIKKDSVTLKNKKGEYIGDHFKEQALMLVNLSNKGYLALFGVGLSHCLAIIDHYLK